MLIDLNKDSCSYEEILFANKYVGNVFNQFFKLKGFKICNNTAVKNDISFFYDYRCPSLFFHGRIIIPNGSPKPFLPLRYFDYPNIDEIYEGIVCAPNQGWMLGFIEKLLISLDKYLLPVLLERNAEFQKIIEDAKRKSEQTVNSQISPVEFIKRVKENSVKKEFYPAFLSFEKTSTREIIESIEKIIA